MWSSSESSWQVGWEPCSIRQTLAWLGGALEKSTNEFPRPGQGVGVTGWGVFQESIREGRGPLRAGCAACSTPRTPKKSRVQILASDQQNPDWGQFDKTNYLVSSTKCYSERKERWKGNVQIETKAKCVWGGGRKSPEKQRPNSMD